MKSRFQFNCSTLSQEVSDCYHSINILVHPAEAKAEQQNLPRETLHRLWLPAPVRPVQWCHNQVGLFLIFIPGENFHSGFFAQISIWPLGARTTCSAVTRLFWGQGPLSSMQCSFTIWPRGNLQTRQQTEANTLTFLISSQKKQVDIEDLDIETVKDMLK